MKNFLQKFQQKDIELTAKLAATPFFSNFWCHQRLRKAIVSSAADAHGVLLDVGCGTKPYLPVFKPFVEKHLGIEYSPESVFRGHKADIFGDAMNLPLEDNSVDTILCTEVLEHLPDPEKAISEFFRILRPGGTLITTAPFIYPVHDTWDFFRYTPKGLAAIMTRRGFEIERVESLSGGGITIALMFNIFWFDLGFLWTKWLYPIGVLLRPLLLIFVFIVNILGLIADLLIPSPQMSFNHLTIGKKK
ncbi:MAG TPA: methyltransferase domain-containing protein [Pyrinomonadaceae bacterium]|nr:methyltransferase domain-containing protein [Pyrinomonadaceae bacterium]